VIDRRLPANEPRIMADLAQRVLRLEQRYTEADNARTATVAADGGLPQAWCGDWSGSITAGNLQDIDVPITATTDYVKVDVTIKFTNQDSTDRKSVV